MPGIGGQPILEESREVIEIERNGFFCVAVAVEIEPISGNGGVVAGVDAGRAGGQAVIAVPCIDKERIGLDIARAGIDALLLIIWNAWKWSSSAQ